MNTVRVYLNRNDLEPILTFRSGANNFIDNVNEATAKLRAMGHEVNASDMGYGFFINVR